MLGTQGILNYCAEIIYLVRFQEKTSKPIHIPIQATITHLMISDDWYRRVSWYSIALDARDSDALIWTIGDESTGMAI